MNYPKETILCSDPKREILETLFNVNQKINVNALKQKYWQQKNKEHLWNHLIEEISIYPHEWKWSEKIYCFIYDIKERPDCPVCSKKINTFYNFKKGYANTCSKYCATQHVERRNKIKKTYGSWTEKQKQEHADKIKEGFQRKYGMDNVFQTEEFKDEHKKKMTEKYGVDNYFKMRDVVVEHWLEKINTDNPSKNKEIKDRANKTVRKKYGEMQGAVPKKQYLETMRKKYGADHFFSTEQGRMSVQNLKNNYGWSDEELFHLFNRKLNHKKYRFGRASKQSLKVFVSLYKWCRRRGIEQSDICFGLGKSKELILHDYENYKRYMYDFTIQSKKIIIEYHGVKFHPKCIDENWEQLYSKKSVEKIFLKDLKKKEFAEKNGYKVLVLWSDESDSINLEKSKNFILEGQKQ